jgi:hypothetical protein
MPTAVTSTAGVTPSAATASLASGTWTSLDLQKLKDGPTIGGQIVAWSGGYLDLWLSGQSSGPATGSLYVWVSTNGRTWTRTGELVDHTRAFGASPVAGGVVVLTQSDDNTTTAWLSDDGTTWTSSPAPNVRLSGGMYQHPPLQVEDSEVAGGPAGVVAAWGVDAVAFSPDGLSWQRIALPGHEVEVTGVAAIGSDFVAVGSSGNDPVHPAAWRSEDGVHWTQTLDESTSRHQAPLDAKTNAGEVFAFVQAGAGGLVADSWSGPFSPDMSWWTSSDGQSWSPGIDPVGGTTGNNGWCEGDGTRLLWFGVPTPPYQGQLWTSLDGTSWTRLALTGDASEAIAGRTTPFLMRDGVLFIGDVAGATWFGSVAR